MGNISVCVSEMLSPVLENKPTRIHSRDEHERLPLHYAASIGYLEGVELLLGKCKCCKIQRDKLGYFPIHPASYGGHVEVVKKLLEYCPDPTELINVIFFTLHQNMDNMRWCNTFYKVEFLDLIR